MAQGDGHGPVELLMVVAIGASVLGGVLYGWLAVGNVAAVLGGAVMFGIGAVFLITLIAMSIHFVSERVGNRR